MKSWFESHHGKRVYTQQRSVQTGDLWEPGPRTVDATRATYVTLDGSRRYYRGMKVIEKRPDRLTVADRANYIIFTRA